MEYVPISDHISKDPSAPMAARFWAFHLGNLDSPLEDLESCGFPESTSCGFTQKNMANAMESTYFFFRKL